MPVPPISPAGETPQKPLVSESITIGLHRLFYEKPSPPSLSGKEITPIDASGGSVKVEGFSPLAVRALRSAFSKVCQSLARLVKGSFGSHVAQGPPSQGKGSSSLEKIVGAAKAFFGICATSPLEGVEGKNAPSAATRRPLEYVFRTPDGVEVAKDVAKPRAKRSEAIASLVATRADAQKRMKEVLEEERARLERRVGQCDRAIEWLEKMARKGEYCGSGDVRAEVAEGEKPSESFSCELTNCYEEQLETESEGKVKVEGSLLRLGSMTDKACNLLSYKALKDVLNLMQKQREVPSDHPPQEIEDVGNQAREVLVEEKTRIEKLREEQRKGGKLTEAQTEAFDEALAALDIKTEGGVSPLEKAYERRHFLLQQQALQFLNIQVQSHGAEVKGGELHLFHVSLLNPSANGVDKSGVAHCEVNEILDQAELFKELNGTTVLLDALEAPYVDSAGVYHVQKPDGVKEDQIKIAAHFVDVVGQRALKPEHRELYAAVNKDALDGMEKGLLIIRDQRIQEGGSYDESVYLLTKLEKCRKAIEKGTVSFALAEDLVEVGRFLGWNLSIGCHSGKDRTGYIAFRIVQQMLSKVVDKDTRILERKKNWMKDFFSSLLYDPDGIPRKIVEANGLLYIKINPLKITLKTLQGKIQAIWNTIGIGLEMLEKKE